MSFQDLRFKILYWAISNSWYAQGAKAPNGTITYIHKLVITVVSTKLQRMHK